ncbi:type II toxin-antitoxin system death-on-curing family toxin [Natranaerofaba carboxydovora]|uniref:type II toxin-antitoxin system death-on-curing family toxin n=1 Tax=Natranaerofaba carboxydovora TaxID=2742683 RepID=UPI001F1453DC|nr:type II toxin-antitoxin system death-on-curing family toxin [Natranaerofaba carboxydovora]UMZ74409.1 Toxin Doc [Natranaerofaba carboxydovora]
MLLNLLVGSYGLRDKNALESALSSPLATFDDQELYPEIFEKVAVLLFGIANNHPFLDGNKRTAFVVALTIFTANGYEIEFTQEEVVSFMLSVARGSLSYKQICKWFTDHAISNNE